MPATTDELLPDAVDTIDRQDEAPKGALPPWCQA